MRKTDRDTIQYHLKLNRKMTGGATLALLPGDPFRVDKIARAMNRQYRELAWNREYRTALARLQDRPALVTSTGIGGPSTAIAIEELARLGVTTFIRVGTTGGIRAGIKTGDVVITTGAVRLDGASRDYAPIEYPAVAHPEILQALSESARRLRKRHHIGITASTDTFYPSQERPDTFSGYLIKRIRGATEEWRNLGVLNYEMESSTLLVLASVFGLRAGCVTGVVVSRHRGEKITAGRLQRGEKNAIEIAVAAAGMLIQSSRKSRQERSRLHFPFPTDFGIQ